MKNDIVAYLCEHLSELLGGVRVGADDDVFDLGADSLVATRLASRIAGDFSLEVAAADIFAYPTPVLLAAALGSTSVAPTAAMHVPTGSATTLTALSPSQLRFWVTEQMGTPDPYRYVTIAYRVAGSVDGRLARAAVEAVVARHEALRSFVLYGDDEPRAATMPFDTSEVCVEITQLGPDQVPRLTVDDQPGPALSVRIFQAGDDPVSWVLFRFDHMWFDGWSQDLILTDLNVAYRALREGRPPAWLSPARQYSEYVAWYSQAQGGDTVTSDLKYWTEHLAGIAPLPAPSASGEPGGTVRFTVIRDLAEAVQALAAARSTTTFAVLLAAYAEALRAEFGLPEVTVGTLSSGRSGSPFHDTVGCFINPLCFRLKADGDAILDAHQELHAALRHECTPFENVVTAVQAPCDGRHPLYQAWLMHYPRRDDELTLFGLHAEPVETEGSLATIDELRLQVIETRRGWDVSLLYRPNWFSAEQVDRIGRGLLGTLSGWTAGGRW